MFNADEKAEYDRMEIVHGNPDLKKQFHTIIAGTTLWRYCVFCGEKIPREEEPFAFVDKSKVIDVEAGDPTE